MHPFVCCPVSFDSGRTPIRIIAHKEAERKTGDGEFWWGLRARLGPAVTSHAVLNGGVVPIFFSKTAEKQGIVQPIRVWNEWRSLDGRRSGTIPKHALVLSDDPGPDDARRDEYFGLVCRSDSKLVIGNLGFINLAQCVTTKNRPIQFLQSAALLLTQNVSPVHVPAHTGGTPHNGIITVVLAGTLVAPWYVRLQRYRVLTQQEVEKLRQYKDGDDWLALVSSLRR
jgi:hypothetical protein